tara:strand:+ start:2060 stop:2449 length:390 start_codon:yes stop_codon:yes gene_type:complete
MALITHKLTVSSAQAITAALRDYVDGLTTAYQDDLRAPLMAALEAQEALQSTLEDYFDDDSTSDIAEHDCDQDACSYCSDDDMSEALRVDAMYVFERMTDMLRADGVDFEEFDSFYEELRGNIKRNGGR